MASGSTQKTESGVTHYSKETRHDDAGVSADGLSSKTDQKSAEKRGALPLNFNLTTMEPCVHSEPSVTRMTALMGHPQRRNTQGCRAGDNYKREQFRPSATRDLEKEKRRLQNLLATGQEEAGPTHSQRDSTERTEQQTDRFQEVLDEIEDRRQFLEEMMAIGKGHQYQHIINTEISQKICELEKIDRNRGEELRTLMMNGKEGKHIRDIEKEMMVG